VSEVKDQQDCGSCWAFSAVGALEGQLHKVHRGEKDFLPLSAQNLVDCAKRNRTDDPNGCNGGLPKDAYIYVREQGLEVEDDYRYTGNFGECKFKRLFSYMKDNGGVYFPVGDEENLKVLIANFGPVSAAIDATILFSSYAGGVFYDNTCSNEIDKLNHAVLIVGYGHDKKLGKDYWLVKNSWSSNWGEDGYIKMARNRNNNCGIATAVSIPKPASDLSD